MLILVPMISMTSLESTSMEVRSLSLLLHLLLAADLIGCLKIIKSLGPYCFFVVCYCVWRFIVSDAGNGLVG